VSVFELLEDFFGAGDDGFEEAGESGDLDAVAFFDAPVTEVVAFMLG